MKRVLSLAALGALLAGSMASSALAFDTGLDESEVLMSYYAYLGEADHYNSKGERLTEYWQVIRQDRANYHRFGIRDEGDESDDLFGDATNREFLEQMLMASPLSDEDAEAIVNDNVWVRVAILGAGSDVTGITVEVQYY